MDTAALFTLSKIMSNDVHSACSEMKHAYTTKKRLGHLLQ